MKLISISFIQTVCYFTGIRNEQNVSSDIKNTIKYDVSNHIFTESLLNAPYFLCRRYIYNALDYDACLIMWTLPYICPSSL